MARADLADGLALRRHSASPPPVLRPWAAIHAPVSQDMPVDVSGSRRATQRRRITRAAVRPLEDQEVPVREIIDGEHRDGSPPSARELTRVTVLLADDHTLFRNGMRLLLERDARIEVVGEATDGDDAVRQTAKLNPDVVLMDLRMPNRDGVDATAAIALSGSSAKVLVLTSFEADIDVFRAFHAGATGYLLKDATPRAIVSSIIAVAQDEHVITPIITDRLLSMAAGGSRNPRSSTGLTRREAEIVKLITSGLGNKQIGFNLKISEKTVRNHVSSLYAKLGITNRTQVVVYAVRNGLMRL